VPYLSISGRVHHMVGLRDDSETAGNADSVPALAAAGRGLSRRLPAAELQPHIAERLGARSGHGHSRGGSNRSHSGVDGGSSSGSGVIGVAGSEFGGLGNIGGGRLSGRSGASSLFTDSSGDAARAAKEVPNDMSFAVYMEDGLPVKWIGKGLKRDGIDIEAKDNLGPWLNDNERLHAWMQNTMNEALNHGRTRAFTCFFGPLTLTRPGTSAALVRKAWLYFPAPLMPEDDRIYHVIIGIVAGDRGGDCVGNMPSPRTLGVEADKICMAV